MRAIIGVDTACDCITGGKTMTMFDVLNEFKALLPLADVSCVPHVGLEAWRVS